MKYSTDRKSLRMPLMLLALFLALGASAQDLLVYHVVGKVEAYYKNGKSYFVEMNKKLNAGTTINVPEGGIIELLDEAHNKRFTIRTAGKGTIEQLSANKGNTVFSLTKNYVSYVKNQLGNKDKVVEAQKYTDFATVTREMKEVKKNNDPKSIFEQFKEDARKEFNDFRSKANSDYRDFVRSAWEEFTAFSGIPKPEEIRVEPVIFSEDQATDKIHLSKWVKKVIKNLKDPVIIHPLKKEDLSSNPEPVGKVEPVEIPAKEQRFSEMPFTYYGCEMKIHLDETKRFNLGGVSRDQIASALEMLSKKDFNNALNDCFKLREEYELCDWAYLNMLIALSEQFCGPKSNEAVLLAGFLYSQSGYKMRYASSGKSLYLLVACKQRIYGRNYFVMDNEDYYPICEGEMPQKLSICPAKFQNEKAMSLVITPQQHFAFKATEKRTITDKFNKSFTAEVSVNKNMIDFYNDYPSFANNDNPYTRWLSYANVPMDKKVADELYPQIKELIKGMTPQKAVGSILQWIQYGIPYAFDYEVWGGDRVFFAEETLFYPGSDCEDRAILFTRMVRDLLHLPCVLVYYPGHLAAAVHFSEEVRGDRFQLADTDYIVCDPTYIGASIGMSMPGMNADEAKLVLLE